MATPYVYADVCGIRRPKDPVPGTLLGPMKLPASYTIRGDTKASHDASSRKSGQTLRGRAHHMKKTFSF